MFVSIGLYDTFGPFKCFAGFYFQRVHQLWIVSQGGQFFASSNLIVLALLYSFEKWAVSQFWTIYNSFKLLDGLSSFCFRLFLLVFSHSSVFRYSRIPRKFGPERGEGGRVWNKVQENRMELLRKLRHLKTTPSLEGLPPFFHFSLGLHFMIHCQLCFVSFNFKAVPEFWTTHQFWTVGQIGHISASPNSLIQAVQIFWGIHHFWVVRHFQVDYQLWFVFYSAVLRCFSILDSLRVACCLPDWVFILILDHSPVRTVFQGFGLLKYFRTFSVCWLFESFRPLGITGPTV